MKQIIYIIFFLLFIGAVIAVNSESDLLVYYPLDTNYSDMKNATSMINDGTDLVNNSCPLGYCAYLDGTDDLQIVAGVTNNMASGTLFLYAKANTTAVDYNLFAKNSAAMRAQFLHANPATQYWSVNGEGAQTSGTFTMQDWHLYVYVWSPSEKTLYIDGVQSVTSGGGTTTPSSGNLIIGTNSVNTNERFIGWIDNVGAYSRALNSSQVAELYNKKGYPLVPPLLATASYPINNSRHNTLPQFNLTTNSASVCNITIDGATYDMTGSSTFHYYDAVALTDGIFSYNMACSNSENTLSLDKIIVMDTLHPTISWNYPPVELSENRNLSLNLTITDSYLQSYNVSIKNSTDSSIFFYQNTNASSPSNLVRQINFTAYDDYNISVCTTDGLNPFCDSMIYSYVSCFPSWQSIPSVCSNNTQLISYTDTNSCGVTDNLPVANGTYQSCIIHGQMNNNDYMLLYILIGVFIISLVLGYLGMIHQNDFAASFIVSGLSLIIIAVHLFSSIVYYMISSSRTLWTSLLIGCFIIGLGAIVYGFIVTFQVMNNRKQKYRG